MLIAIIPLIVALIGLLMFALGSPNPKVEKIGWMFLWTGTLVTLMAFAHHTIKIG